MSLVLSILATVAATPSTLPAVLHAAQSGDIIVLSAGNYPMITLPYNRDYRVPLQIDARAARLTGLTIRKNKGVHVTGGRLIGPRTQSHGVVINEAARVRVSGMTINGPRIGVGIVRSQDIEINGNQFDGVRSDGVNVAGSQRIRIIGNACLNFRPIPAVYDAAGKLVTDGDHPDCIQGWTLRGEAPTADVTIENNSAYGHMQGVWFGDPGTGGYDRIVVRNNNVTLSAWHGISILQGRNTIVTGNTVRTVPQARSLAFPFQPIKVWIYGAGSTGRFCGNIVEAIPNGFGTAAC